MTADPPPASLTDAVPLVGGVQIRPFAESDAKALAAAYSRNRDHLQPWEPTRPDVFYTAEGQLARLREQEEERRGGRLMAWMLWEDGQIIGTVSLVGMVRGPFHSANLGYWIAADQVGRGLATTTVRAVCQTADQRMRLHRLQATTMLANARSQRVLAKCGFHPIGKAERYLHIDGAWRDHLIFQLILNDRPPS
ncbi:GNAT family N-acetyltransferase [Streptomyces zagrosensis]|uniref:Ribosomal-protein-alanine N-acetyltransferase n=1 Tax=Streptomyces zagrosensis TaxID=1042984 RepID=A0A7W9Q430_9ACTN|nr:GNAT family protein [Streptomyces zagrosensis]MBB5933230.1 ribosomal-protein-alanine N-acetyltransferase [Streptomyces zagrosensis]